MECGSGGVGGAPVSQGVQMSVTPLSFVLFQAVRVKSAGVSFCISLQTGFNFENKKLFKLEYLKVYRYSPRSWLFENVPVQPPHLVFFSHKTGVFSIITLFLSKPFRRKLFLIYLV